MLPPFSMGLGGPIGHGDHYMSWIHLEDMLNGIVHLLTHQDCRGIYNFTAPNPVTNKEFSQQLAKAINRPCFLTTPPWALKLMMGEMSDLLIYGQRVVPNRLLDTGFKFSYPNLEEALQSLNLK